MSPLKLYYNDASPAVRGTLLTIAALDLDVELVFIDLVKKEQLKPEFLKKNPLHTVPTLEDGDFIIWDSHVINAYLVQKYGKDDSLYPKDLQKRSVVDQRNFFDNGVLFPRIGRILFYIFFKGTKTVNKEAADFLVQGYHQLEDLLANNSYVAGNHLTIADFSIIATISSANIAVPIAENRFPKIWAWMARMQELPYYTKANQEGLDNMAGMFTIALQKLTYKLFTKVRETNRRYPKISAWMARMQGLPYYSKANQEGLDKMARFYKLQLS